MDALPDEMVRRPDGSIDTEHYVRRGIGLQRGALRDALTRTIGFLRGTALSAWLSVAGRRVR